MKYTTHSKNQRQSPRARINTNASGEKAERLAEQFLSERGLILQVRNFSRPCGEIDLIMRDGECIVFVEVRKRAPGNRVSACESVDRRKQNRLIKTAQWYLQSSKLLDRYPCRFDVIAIGAKATQEQELENSEIVWIKDAFNHY